MPSCAPGLCRCCCYGLCWCRCNGFRLRLRLGRRFGFKPRLREVIIGRLRRLFLGGLLLSGGADVAPALYGEETLPCCGEILPIRDSFEIGIFQKALKASLPVLGICRGIQVINVALGGTLYQDIETQLKGAIKHPCYDTPRDKVHEVTVTEDSLLYRASGLTRFGVNSRHHQGIKHLGKGLVATAYYGDGLIEAVDYPQARYVTAVQWHPESLSDRYPEAQTIFNAFVEACKG